mgnify:CR=1 FL=1
MMTFQDIGIAHHLYGKLIDILLIAYRYADERRDVFADLLAIEQSVIAADHPSGFELFDPLHYRGRRKVDLIGDIGESPPTVILQNIKYF